jgi:hypothetical protein
VKEKIYRHLLHLGLIHVRNFFEARTRDPARFEAARCAAQLLHYIPPLLVNGAPGQGDVYFLEVGATEFLQRYPCKADAYFLQTADLILELHESIGGQATVKWGLPHDVEGEVRRFRQMSSRRR